ncbi:MAG: hypothetical protein JXB88_15500 [Spirochaetales bacterium]|nr:hypothetical protein [Spirochaetales bacterium]
MNTRKEELFSINSQKWSNYFISDNIVLNPIVIFPGYPLFILFYSIKNQNKRKIYMTGDELAYYLLIHF